VGRFYCAWIWEASRLTVEHFSCGVFHELLSKYKNSLSIKNKNVLKIPKDKQAERANNN
jgi:hypothetical protein